MWLSVSLASLVLFVYHREFAERIIVFALSLWLAYESAFWIMQLIAAEWMYHPYHFEMYQS